jgi:glutaredoxin
MDNNNIKIDNLDNLEITEFEPIEFEEPSIEGFTVYTKSGCKFCTEVKKLLKKNKLDFHVIDANDYLLYSKEDFLFFIKTITNTDYKTFPMVFYNNTFIGGYIDTEKYIENVLLLECDF